MVQRLKRLNDELTKAQRALLSTPSKDRAQKKKLKRICRELDARLGCEHENFKDWQSTCTGRTETSIISMASTPRSDASDAGNPAPCFLRCSNQEGDNLKRYFAVELIFRNIVNDACPASTSAADWFPAV